ncbi:hypothetical protein MASR2M79_18010 [Aminivibrio sp.]
MAVGQQAGPNIGNVGLKLVEKTKRKRSAFEIGEILREHLRNQPGIENLNVIVSSPIKALFLGSKPLNIEVYGEDPAEVTAHSKNTGVLAVGSRHGGHQPEFRETEPP